MLDIKTIMVLFLISTVIDAVAIAVIWKQNRRRYSGISLWLIAMTLQVLGTVLHVLRFKIPDFFSMAVANTIIQGGTLMIVLGLGLFCGKRVKPWYNALLLALFFAVLTYFSVLSPNLLVRDIAISSILILYSFQAAWLLLRRTEAEMRYFTRFTGMVFAAYAAFNSLRLLLIFIRPYNVSDFYQSGQLNAIVIMSYIALNSCLTIGLVLMVSGRLLSEMKVQEEKYLSAFQTSPYAITITEIETGKLIELNDAFVSMMGYSREEAIGKTTIELGIWQDVSERGRLLDAIKRGHAITGQEFSFRTKDGRVIIGQYSGKPIRLTIGTCLFSSIDDITARRNIENEVTRNESRLKLLVDILQRQSSGVQELLDYSLSQTIRLTGSKIGYIYHYSDEKKQFVLNTWSKDVMAECKIVNPSTTYALDKTGFWGEAVRQGKPMINNDFAASHPQKKGYPEGHVRLLRFMTVPIFRDSKIVGVVGLANKDAPYDEADILQVSLMMEVVWQATERMQADERIKALLAEKELILKEVHHRIKNNMTTIHALLSLQAMSLKESSAVTALEDAQSRIKSMTILYEKLYISTSFNQVSAREYLSSLVDEIVANFPNAGRVRIEKHIDAFLLDSDKVQSLGIIINELITNIMKYAFLGRSEGSISIRASINGDLVSLAISDDGNGIPESVNFENSSGFGLMLIGMLTKQLNGTIRIERGNGTSVYLEYNA